MCFCHIHRRPLTPLRHTLLLLIPLTSCACFYKITQQPQFALPMYSQVCGPSRGVWSTYPGPQPLEKTTFPSPRSHLFIAAPLSVRAHEAFPIYGGITWTGLILCGSCVGKTTAAEFMSIASYYTLKTLLHSSPHPTHTSGSYNHFIPPLTPRSLSLGKYISSFMTNIYPSHLWLSAPLTRILCTLAGCELLC